MKRSTIALLTSAITLFGCAGGATSAATPNEPAAPIRQVATTSATSTTVESPQNADVTTNTVAECDLVCERAKIVARSADGPDLNALATANANNVIEAMHDDLLACYKKRVAVNPNAHGDITVDIVIAPDGQVRTVETTGGAVLGDGTMGCIVNRIKRASFDAPRGGGTLRIHVPFSLRRVTPGEETL